MHVFHVSEAILNGSGCVIGFLDAGSKFCFNPWGKLRSQKIPSIHHVHNILWGLWSAYGIKLHPINDPQTEDFLSFLQNGETGAHSDHTDSQLGVRESVLKPAGASIPHTVCVLFWWGFPHKLLLCTHRGRLELDAKCIPSPVVVSLPLALECSSVAAG